MLKTLLQALLVSTLFNLFLSPPLLAVPSSTTKAQTVSLNFQDISVRKALQILADFKKVNMIMSDSVQGNISLHLEDIVWQDALALILTTQGLDQRQIGNVLLIASATELAAKDKQQLQAQQETAALTPLRAELINLHYANAADIALLLKNKEGALLSERGTANVYSKTNTLWIQDTTLKIQEIREFVKQLDVPVPQVLIEARIVLVDNSYEEELGIRWGVSAGNHLSGTLDGANKLNKSGDPSEVPVDDRLNVDLPARLIGDNQPASLGLALINLGDDILLDLELSALESEGRGEVISSPHIVTANQQTASIEKGQEIPFEESTSSGATATVFKKAVLSLKVTPHITPDNKIFMQIQVNQDRPSTTLKVKGVPGIDTRRIQTQVLVNNGDTVVLGGIYEQETGNSVTRVPFLGNLPWIGYFFRSKSVLNNRSELLVFITPKVLEQGTPVLS